MKEMDNEQIKNFLRYGTFTAKICTIGKDGSPHVVPVWFLVEEDKGMSILFTTYHKSVKAKYLLTDPRVSLCVDDQIPPFSFVMINGKAEVNTEPKSDELFELSTEIATRYMGPGNAEAYGKRNAVKGEVIVKIASTKMMGRKDIAEW